MLQLLLCSNAVMLLRSNAVMLLRSNAVMLPRSQADYLCGDDALVCSNLLLNEMKMNNQRKS